VYLSELVARVAGHVDRAAHDDDLGHGGREALSAFEDGLRDVGERSDGEDHQRATVLVCQR